MDKLKSIIKQTLKEVSIHKGIDGQFDTALQWIWLFGGKELLKNKLEIYSPSNEFRTFKKAMETGKITIQDLDKATQGEHGQADNIAFSQTAVWKQDLKPYLDNYNQEKFNNLNIDLEEESGTGGGASAGAFNPGEGPQTAEKVKKEGTDAAYKKNTNSKGTTNNIYVKNFKYKLVNQKALNKQAKGIEVKQMWKENVNEAQLDVDAYIDSLNIDKPELKTFIKSRLEGFDTLEQKLNELLPLLQNAKQKTLDYYKNNPNFNVLYGTDLANDYLNDLINLFKD
jgi:hypothetical protein